MLTCCCCSFTSSPKVLQDPIVYIFQCIHLFRHKAKATKGLGLSTAMLDSQGLFQLKKPIAPQKPASLHTTSAQKQVVCKGSTFLLLSRGLEDHSRVDGHISLPFDFTTCISVWKYPCLVVPFSATYQHKEKINCARLPHSFLSLNSIFKSSSVMEEIKIHTRFLSDFGQMFEARINLLQQIFAKSQPIHCSTIPKATCQIYGTFASYGKKHNYTPIHLCINFSMQQNRFLQPVSATTATMCTQQKPGLLTEVAPFLHLYALVLFILCTICYQKALHSLKLCLRRKKKIQVKLFASKQAGGGFLHLSQLHVLGDCSEDLRAQRKHCCVLHATARKQEVVPSLRSTTVNQANSVAFVDKLMYVWQRSLFLPLITLFPCLYLFVWKRTQSYCLFKVKLLIMSLCFFFFFLPFRCSEQLLRCCELDSQPQDLTLPSAVWISGFSIPSPSSQVGSTSQLISNLLLQ